VTANPFSLPGVTASFWFVSLPASFWFVSLPASFRFVGLTRTLECCQFVDQQFRVVDFLCGPPVEVVHVRGGAVHLLGGGPPIDAHDLPEQVRERLPFSQYRPGQPPGDRSRLVEDRRQIGRLRRPVTAVVTESGRSTAGGGTQELYVL